MTIFRFSSALWAGALILIAFAIASMVMVFGMGHPSVTLAALLYAGILFGGPMLSGQDRRLASKANVRVQPSKFWALILATGGLIVLIAFLAVSLALAWVYRNVAL